MIKSLFFFLITYLLLLHKIESRHCLEEITLIDDIEICGNTQAISICG